MDFRQKMLEQRKMLTQLDPEGRINLFLKTIRTLGESSGYFTSSTIPDLKLDSVRHPSPGTAIVVFSFTVHPSWCNFSGNLHGGAQATIFDDLTSTALMGVKDPGPWMDGAVSRTLNVTYLRPAPAGEKLLCECEVVHVGKSLSLLRGVLKRARDGAAVSTCEHNRSRVEPVKSWGKL